MIQFKVPLALSQLLTPALCTGILFAGTILFAYIYLRSRDPLYLSTFLLGLFGFVFVGSELFLLILGGAMRNPSLGMHFHRTEQLAGAFFLFGLPNFLRYMLVLNRTWQRINRILAYLGLAIAVGMAVAAYVEPSLFISMTEHAKNWMANEADHGRGQEGILYTVRDAMLGVLILYGLVCIAIDIAKNKNIGGLILPLVGLIMAVLGAANDIIFIYFRYDFILNGVLFSRFSAGITLFILFCMAGLTRHFIDKAKEVELAEGVAMREAEKNRDKSEFMKNVLQKSSETIYSSTEGMSSSIQLFQENTENQAAATEEVTASIEEVSAGTDNVAKSAEDQHRNLTELGGVIQRLSIAIENMAGVMKEAMEVTGLISGKAKSGEQSIRVMSDAMEKIGQSSGEMNGIIRIINDISDRINLLSLNAAIEAARAGEAGKGFAVVADEISKLADQTAASIKDIDRLIKVNVKEINTGAKNMTTAVETIGSIIRDIEAVASQIQIISEYMSDQVSSNERVSREIEQVQGRSEDIMNAMLEQKTAIDEISKTISQINELSQSNATRVHDMAESSKTLVSMVDSLHRDIEEHRE